MLQNTQKESSKSILIKHADIGAFFKERLQEIKLNCITIFSLDLNLIYNYFLENELLSKEFYIKPFLFKSKCYSICLQHVVLKKKKIIFKDYYNFISSNKWATTLYDQGKYLYELYEELLIQFNININSKNILSLTSVSAKVFAFISTDKQKNIKKLNATEDTFIRKAYYGGRNEIYEPIGYNVFYYDVNSLYPYIMKNHNLPIGSPVFYDANYLKSINITTFYGFLDVLVEVPTDILPILPFRSSDKYNELGIIYPTGVFRGIYFSEELLFAIEKGCKILRIFGGYAFASDIIFEDFVNRLYELRTQTLSPFMKKSYKDIMNSLYGRFACIFEKEINIHDEFKQNMVCIKKIYNTVSISAAITALARIHMYKLQEQLKLKLIYWDTDGFFVKEALVNHQVNTSLGALRLIHKINKVVFIAQKMYIYHYNQEDYQYTLKGITINNYLLNGPLLIDQIEKALLKITNFNKFEYTITFELKNKIINNLEIKTFTIYNKRAINKTNSIINTRPWHINQTPIGK